MEAILRGVCRCLPMMHAHSIEGIDEALRAGADIEGDLAEVRALRAVPGVMKEASSIAGSGAQLNAE